MRAAVYILRCICSLVLLTVLVPARSAASPWLCLPPAFDHGKRLHPLPSPEVYWLPLLLRQHELCWRRLIAPSEQRVAVFGSSAVYGLPLPVHATFADLINQQYAADGVSAHLFNLAFVAPYQVRDAMIIDQALAYEPDVILYPMTLAEFRHLAPIAYPTFAHFFNMNDGALRALADQPPKGLEEPFARYMQNLARTESTRHATDELQDAGLYARRAARAAGESIAAALNSPRPPFRSQQPPRQRNYNCAKTLTTIAKEYRDWKTWSILPYLAELQRTRGIRVLVVHWPVAHEPVDDCYSIRYTAAGVADCSAWLREETARHDLAYLDLRDLLAADLFIDSIHVSRAGHRQIADQIVPALAPLLRDRSNDPVQERSE